jgi:hypothetical protein
MHPHGRVVACGDGTMSMVRRFAAIRGWDGKELSVARARLLGQRSFVPQRNRG